MSTKQVEGTVTSRAGSASGGIVLPLRLSGSPATTLNGYLRLEDALDALGRHDHPDIWGRLPGWSHMPFRWASKEQRYIRHELRLMGTRARLRRLPVDLALPKAERQACTRLYKKVRATMREAFETGRLAAHAVHHATGSLSPMLAPAVWLKQARPIFYTGWPSSVPPTAPRMAAKPGAASRSTAPISAGSTDGSASWASGSACSCWAASDAMAFSWELLNEQ